MRRLLLALVMALASPAKAQAPLIAPPAPPSGPERFQSEIEAFTAADLLQPPAPCSFLFVGSSSVRFWRTLAEDMAPALTVNRGFGGSTVADVDFWFDRVVTPYHPRGIFFYAGENDLWAGRAPVDVIADFDHFMALKTQALGDTPVWFISLKPSKLRWTQLAEQAVVNDAVRAEAAMRTDLHYIDVVPAMLVDGAPREIFVGDGLHMTPEGYAIWAAIVRPVVEAEAVQPTVCKTP